MKEITERLFSMQDESYRQFQYRLIPTVPPESVIGVRTPNLRKLARELDDNISAEFLGELPHKYYEEDNLHAFLIERIKSYDGVIDALDRFLPYVNNWATCDMMSPKALTKDIPALTEKLRKWIASGQVYTVRFAVGQLMSGFLGEHYEQWQPTLVASIKSDEYYIKMMIAWYFATGLALRYDDFLHYIYNDSLDDWTHNKAIQKAIESRRVTDENKRHLRQLKRRVQIN